MTAFILAASAAPAIQARELTCRPHGTDAFTKVATVNTTAYYVEDPDEDFDYDVIPVQ